jgi:hypothetical protein
VTAITVLCGTRQDSHRHYSANRPFQAHDPTSRDSDLQCYRRSGQRPVVLGHVALGHVGL